MSHTAGTGIWPPAPACAHCHILTQGEDARPQARKQKNRSLNVAERHVPFDHSLQRPVHWMRTRARITRDQQKDSFCGGHSVHVYQNDTCMCSLTQKFQF